ncbi:hypothetical protein [Streptomyces muensis]|uniref:Uncharacterized protein n=1 Tax=Streptomyces muensis TaxID=1077944 RepID=A0A9X1TMJ4_STRM4|nr:hypothetical protein [Streptomyces muensis]MCF1596140.1 hypothetical protein [Streptomyces muensis]
MTDPTTRLRDGITLAPRSPAEIRAERRRIIESIRALRRLLDKRRTFEVADRRRLNREAGDRGRAEAAHAEEVRRIEEKQARQERSLTQGLDSLDGRREQQETQALAVLRREFVERRLRNTPLTVSELNGFGTGLIRDLAAQGISTAADFTGVTWGRAPNGKGGNVLYIHRADGHRIHVNGIGQHRSGPLMEWRQAALARAEARAPRTLPPDERHRISEIIKAERTRLRKELSKASLTAENAHIQATRRHTEALELLAASEQEAARLAAERRAEFDAMAEQLLALQSELSAHMDRHGDVGRSIRRAQRRALRPVSALPAIPTPRAQADLTRKSDSTPAPSPAPAPAATARASLAWLLPILYFGFTTVVGVGELAGNTAPLGLVITSRLFALATTAELLRLWIPRRRRQTQDSMPSGTGWQATGMFLALAAAGMFADEKSDVFGAACVVSVLAALLLLAGTGLRIRPPPPPPPPPPSTTQF